MQLLLGTSSLARKRKELEREALSKQDMLARSHGCREEKKRDLFRPHKSWKHFGLFMNDAWPYFKEILMLSVILDSS